MNLTQVILHHDEPWTDDCEFKLFQKLGGFVALTRRSLLNQNNSRFLSSEVQPRSENEIAPQVTSTEPEKDKLYSRLEIELKGIEPEVMKSYAWFATRAAEHLGIKVGQWWELKLAALIRKLIGTFFFSYPVRKPINDRWTLLKSVHVHSKHLASYEVRTYYRFMNFHNLTQSTLETYLEYIQRNLPEGTAMKATKVEIQELPEHLQKHWFGATRD